MRKLFVIAFILSQYACRHEKIPPPPLPEIVITSPTANEHFVKDDIIHITGTVTHEISISEVAVHMVNIPTGTEFFHNHFSAGGSTTYHFNAEYLVPNNVTSTFRVEVEATDINNNEVSEEVVIIIN